MRLPIAVAVAFLLLAPAAHAGTQTARDPDDVQGHLDVRKISLEHDIVGYTFTIQMHDGWGPKAIKSGRGGINIYLDTAGDERFNYLIVLAKDRKEVSCLVYNRKGDLKTEAEANKTSGFKVKCEVRKSHIKRDRKSFKWAVQTSWRLSNDSYTFDYAPNEGYLSHKIPL